MNEEEVEAEQQALAEWEDSWSSPTFLEGLDVGESIGQYNAYREAQIAFDMGEIELWLEYHTPKSFEDWRKWEDERGSHDHFKARWKKNVQED